MKDTPLPCPRCSRPVPADAPGRICPACALLGVIDPPSMSAAATADPPNLEEIAAAFPELEILEVIGQGGMGIVFKARQMRLERFVALKILLPTLAAQPGFSERFTREARALARLTHPNIVSVFDFGEAAGFCYLLMEYVDGVNLRQAMRSGLTPGQALLLVPIVCESLQFAHDRGILHRDIKPENILIDSHGSPKLADFGIAKLAADPLDPHLTRSGIQLGTAAYMAPEQIEKPGTADHRADIYSLGVVLYEMLTGELPLGRFPAPSERSTVATDVDTVVLRALEKERERRQQSAGEMKTQLEEVRDQPFRVEPSATPSPQHPPRKDLGFAYLWWVLFGLCGGHRFYLRQYGWGWLYFFTGGLCMIGWLVDLFLLPSQVERFNGTSQCPRTSFAKAGRWRTSLVIALALLLTLGLLRIISAIPSTSIGITIRDAGGDVEIGLGGIKVATGKETVKIGWDGIHVTTGKEEVTLRPIGIQIETGIDKTPSTSRLETRQSPTEK